MLKARHYKQINDLIIISNDIELMSLKFKIDDEIFRRNNMKEEIRKNLPEIPRL